MPIVRDKKVWDREEVSPMVGGILTIHPLFPSLLSRRRTLPSQKKSKLRKLKIKVTNVFLDIQVKIKILVKNATHW